MKNITPSAGQTAQARIISSNQLIQEMNRASRNETKVWLMLALCAWVLLGLSLWVKA